jgi:hypothetical protein
MVGALGVDKLGFLLPASEIAFSPEFAPRVEDPKNGSTGEALYNFPLYRDSRGRSVSGLRAVLNTPDYQLTLKPDRSGGAAVCLVQFSAGCFADTNLNPLDADECAEAALKVQRDVRKRGCKLDLEQARLWRVDVARNVMLDESVASYAPIFSGVGLRKRVRKLDFGGTGFVVGNKQWEIAGYDKGEQMRESGFVKDSPSDNVFRPELRLLKGSVIGKRLGAKTLPELRAGWSNLKPVYLQSLKQEVLKMDSSTDVDALISWEAVARHAAESGGNTWTAFKSEAALMMLLKDKGLPAAEHFVATAFGYDARTERGRKWIERRTSDLRRAAGLLALQAAAPSGRTLLTLYRELEKKLLAA